MLNLIIQDPTVPLEGAEGISESISLLELTLNGGFMMIPIFLLWMLGIYVFVERMMNIKKASQTPDDFKDRIRQLVTASDIQGARLMCVQTDTPVARMIEKGVSKIGSSLKNIEVSIENLGKIEIYKLEKNLNLLATIAGAAPMIGFLGTVVGMIQAFMAVAQEEGAVSPKLLSGGIYEALITTAAGLIVGILAYLGYNYLVSRVSKVIHTMEYNAIEFIELLQEPQKK
ncbi:MAG: MotA/TolQ/ExbB proton channel family protein [Cytophagales bacterium]|nr:MotA/TolQ/ExbB proton channel family protein [Cytophagales bacterium]